MLCFWKTVDRKTVAFKISWSDFIYKVPTVTMFVGMKNTSFKSHYSV